MGDISILVWGMLFGAVGMGFWVYGRRQRSGVPLLVGTALILLTYFVSNVYLIVLIGVGLIALPYFLRR